MRCNLFFNFMLSMRNSHKNAKGFTLIEILVVVALIAILAAITIIAINPARNFADARNTQRSSDVTQILNAITQFTSEVGNSLSGLTGGATVPDCDASTGPTSIQLGTGTGNLDLTAELVPTYLVELPRDPSTGTEEATGYAVCVAGSGRITVLSLTPENGDTIEVSR